MAGDLTKIKDVSDVQDVYEMEVRAKLQLLIEAGLQ